MIARFRTNQIIGFVALTKQRDFPSRRGSRINSVLLASTQILPFCKPGNFRLIQPQERDQALFFRTINQVVAAGNSLFSERKFPVILQCRHGRVT